jgi:hypothetical protein
MKIQRAFHILLAVILALPFCCPVFSQNKEFKPDIRKTEDGIPYVSTGVGYDSRINLPRFSLRLVFSAKTGKYLADIDLEITPGPRGRPIRIHSKGPWLDVDLLPGRYKVIGRTIKGQEASKAFAIVKGRVSQIKLVWDISDEEI